MAINLNEKQDRGETRDAKTARESREKRDTAEKKKADGGVGAALFFQNLDRNPTLRKLVSLAFPSGPPSLDSGETEGAYAARVGDAIAKAATDTDDPATIKAAYDELAGGRNLGHALNVAVSERIKDYSNKTYGLDPDTAGVDEYKIFKAGYREKQEKDVEAQKELEQGKAKTAEILTAGQKFATEQQGRIEQEAGAFRQRAQTERERLAADLSRYGTQALERQTPGILEGLNSRGLLSSETTLTKSLSEAARDIELENQGYLRQFDQGAFNQEEALRGGALNALVSGNQAAFDASQGLDLDTLAQYQGNIQSGLESIFSARKGGMERQFVLDDQAREYERQKRLARAARRNATTNALISGGLALGGAALGAMSGGTAMPLVAMLTSKVATEYGPRNEMYA